MARARTRVFAPDRQKKEKASRFLRLAFIYAGNDLLSHTLSRAVQSALRGLTAVFGMGTGGSPAVRSPTNLRGVCVASEPRAEIPSKAEGSLHHIFSKIVRTISHN